MSRKRITKTGSSAAILLSPDMLEQLGIDVGDEIEVSIVERTLLIRSLDEAERARKIEAATNAVFKQRHTAYKELARGGE